MSDYKVLALDLDGTLMTNEKKIAPAVKAAIYRMRDAGYHVVLASGRPTPGMYHVADELEMKKYGGYILSFNGGSIMNYQTGEIVYSQMVKQQIRTQMYIKKEE